MGSSQFHSFVIIRTRASAIVIPARKNFGKRIMELPWFHGRAPRARLGRIFRAFPGEAHHPARLTPDQQKALFGNTARSIGGASREIQIRHIGNCLKADPVCGKGVADALGIPLSEVPK
jgi:hypothetical protein